MLTNMKGYWWGLVLLSAGLASCGAPEPVMRQKEVYSTLVSITLFQNTSNSVFDHIFQRLETIDQQMSAQRPTSQISQVSRQAGIAPVKVSSDTLWVLQNSLRMSQLTDGIFDPTIGPVTFLWNVEGDNPHVPSPAQIAAAKALVNWRDVVINPTERTVYLTKPGMRLDFGGIAKGYAMDEAVRIAKAAGDTVGIFNMGNSSICLLGTKPGHQPWRVGLQTPEYGAPRDSIMGIVEGYNFVVETSGPYERYFVQDGKYYHHIMDPRTGAPAQSGLAQVTLLMPVDTKLGDGLSTSCFILGLDKGMKLIESLPGAQAIFVTTDHKVFVTPGAVAQLTLTNPNYHLATFTPSH